MNKKRYNIKREPEHRYQCRGIWITPAVSRQEGSLSITDVTLPLHGNGESPSGDTGQVSTDESIFRT